MTNLEIRSSLYDTEGTWETIKHEIMVDGTKVGSAYTMTDTEDDSMTYLESIDIDENFRNHGYGTQAIKELVEKYRHIYLAPTDENNRRLYERLGKEMESDVPEVDQGFGVYEITR